MKSDDILKVIENFKKVLPMATKKGHLNMSEMRVKGDDYQCGTVHCHGGWYTVATCKMDKHILFVEGAEKLARHLGFKSPHDLKLWAEENPKLWGNDNGYDMFGDKLAFLNTELRPKGAKTLQDIVDHWTEVYKRVKKLKKKKVK